MSGLDEDWGAALDDQESQLSGKVREPGPMLHRLAGRFLIWFSVQSTSIDVSTG